MLGARFSHLPKSLCNLERKRDDLGWKNSHSLFGAAVELTMSELELAGRRSASSVRLVVKAAGTRRFKTSESGWYHRPPVKVEKVI